MIDSTRQSVDVMLSAKLSEVRRLHRVITLGEGLGFTIAVLAGIFCVSALTDNLASFPTFLCWAFFLLFCGGVAWLTAARVVAPVAAQRPDEWAALMVERVNPNADNIVINAIQLARSPAASAHPGVQLVVAEASHFLQGLDIRQVVHREDLRRRLIAAIVAIVALVAYATLFPTRFENSAQRLLMPWLNVMPITRTHLQVTPGDQTVLSGDTVAIAATLSGEVPESADIHSQTRGERWTGEQMQRRSPGEYGYQFSNLRETTWYRVDAGDARSPVYCLKVVQRPFIKSISLRYDYPASLRLQPKVEDNSSGDVMAVAGTRVTVDALVSKPAREAKIVFNHNRAETAQIVRGSTISAEFTVDQPGGYHFELKDIDGYGEEKPKEYAIQVMTGGALQSSNALSPTSSGSLEQAMNRSANAQSAGTTEGNASAGSPVGSLAKEKSPLTASEQTALKKALQKTAEAIKLEEAIVDQKRKLLKESRENLSRIDAKALQDILKQQKRLEELLKEAHGDLRDLLKHEYTGALVAQLKSLEQQVQRAEVNVPSQTIHLPADPSILDALKNITQRIEDLKDMYLPNKPDHTKWDLEDIDASKLGKVPLVPLPDKLEDMIGDLLDSEDQLADDTKDMSSNWATPDMQAGGPVLGGPISNFSAKGKTGNTLPDNNDVTGRSGEGRSGRSNGELVQDSVRGDLGGRKTPMRLTKDPFEKQFVPERNPSDTGGATGGGKQSGQGDYGLPGNAPLQVLQQAQAMAMRQAKLRVRAELLRNQLSMAYYPTPKLDEALRLMRDAERDLKQGKVAGAELKQKRVLQLLRSAKKQVKEKAQVSKDRGWFLPATRQQRFLDSLDVRVPNEYRDMVKRYYEYLSHSMSR